MRSAGSSLLRVLVVHRQLLAAEVMALALGASGELLARACREDAEQAVAEARSWPADVAIVALATGYQVKEALKREAGGVKVLGLAGGEQAALSSSLEDLGLAGVIPDSADVTGIIAAVKAAASGYVIMPRAASGRASRSAKRETMACGQPSGGWLTAREREIVGLAVQGLTDRDIARVFGVSLSQVRTCLREARSKVGARTRMQLVGLAIRQGGLW